MIYFDQSATTQPSAAAVAAMQKTFAETYANPSSVHGAGVAARRAAETARENVLSALFLGHRTTGRIIFTGSGTEANNLAVFGSVYAKKRPDRGGSRGTILLSDGEHSSVGASVERLEADGFTIRAIPTTGGKLDFDALDELLTPDVILCSVMLVNNETGAVYDVRRAADAVRTKVPAAVFHTDAVQGFMKVPFTPQSLGADLVTVSGHKIGGPKGVGALWVADEIVTAKKLIPWILGGGQEDGFRSGTLNTPGIAGFGAAAAEALRDFKSREGQTLAVRGVLSAALAAVPGVTLNLPPEGCRVPGILSVTLPRIKSETMLNFLTGQGICVSAGSACSSHGKHVSRPLSAFGLAPADADCTIRLSFNHTNTEDEAREVARAIAEGVAKLAQIR